MSRVRVDRPFRTSLMWHLGGLVARVIAKVLEEVGRAIQR